ncbi:MAG: biotin--[acetyl-CoA-carboxylase] ligase, partial [Gammaproteobacteria bacterium]
ELLERDTIRQALSNPAALAGLETFLSIDSTNQYLMQMPEDSACPQLVLAEHQRAGRGRRGRTWQSPLAGNLYLSLLWRFHAVSANFASLSLVIGALVCRVLRRHGVEQLGLKWPNDVLCRGKKLCGILIEMRGETHGPYEVVIGIGLNLVMPASVGRQIEQPWIALQDVTPTLPSRNVLAADLVEAMLAALPQFANEGLQPFLDEWRELDSFRDSAVVLQLGDRQIHGIARGVDEQGSLLVEHDGKLQRYYSGEISLRKQ